MPAATSPLLFCEGKPNSLDHAVLTRLLDSPVTLKPLGGKRGLKAYVQGTLATYDGSAPTYMVFRDRDLDVEPPVAPQLIPIEKGKPIYGSYRACIESYLLSGALIHDFWEYIENRHGAAPTVESLDALIAEAARRISDYQAVRWALATTLRLTDFGTVRDKLSSGSGELPETLGFLDCLQSAEIMITMFQSNAAAFSIEEFRSRAESYRINFTSPGFYAEQQYLVWFHGKDLSTAVAGLLGFSAKEMDNYLGWAVKNFDPMSFPDLVELQVRCRSL